MGRFCVAVVCLALVPLVAGGPVGIPYPRYQNDDPFAHSPNNEIAPTGVPDDDPLDTSTPAPRVGSKLHAVNFMQKFGYIPKGDSDADFLFTPQALEESIKRMQKFGGIPQTGEIDNATVELMQTPRCGLPDVEPEGFGEHTRTKRYIIGSSGWNKRNLTYFIANWSPQLYSKENVQKELRRAFDSWSGYSHLEFREIETTDADIVIFFASYDHHDGYSFDGPSGILAHAYYPYEFGHYGGDVHFDESEKWTIKPKDEYDGLDFFTVAVHEIGHSLGLAHSPVSGSIMFPYYKGYEPNFFLDYDDIMAMWELYIKRKLEGDDAFFNRTTTTTTTTTTPTPPTTDTQTDENSDGGKAGGDDDDDDDDDDHDDGVLSDEPDDDDDDDDTVLNEAGGSDPADGDDDDDNDGDEGDDEHVRYHGDFETVDEHIKRVAGGVDSLPNLPTLPPEGDDVHRRGRPGEDDIYEQDKKRREEEEKRREEERKRQREEEEERKRWEEEIRRREAEARRREEEERRRWEQEEEEGYIPPTTAPEEAVPDLCDGHFDAMAVLRQELFIFKGKFLWRYSERGSLREGYPSLIHKLFNGLPTYIQKVDAVYERPSDGSILFFTGKYYYVHNGNRIIEENLPLTSLGLPEMLTQIDAAFYWPRAKKTYFFSRNEYYRYDEKTQRMDSGYPKYMGKWNGLPDNLDAVFTWKDGISYFVKGQQYWKYDNVKIRPYTDYPQNAFQYWASCTNTKTQSTWWP